jgi:hypothetical protein
MSFRTILRRSLPTCLLLTVGVASAAPSDWARHASAPEPRTEVAAAFAGGEIVVVGGFVENGTNSARVDAYSISADRWRRLPDLPVAVDHAAAASANGAVYVVGGYGPDRRPLRTAFVLAQGRWRALAPLPEARAASAAAVARARLFVLGGVDGGRALALDLKSGRWSRLPGPSPREHLAAAASGNAVYALGGRSAGIDTNTRRFEAYDARTRRWTTLEPVPQARGGTGAALVNGLIVYVGRVYALLGGPVPGLTVSGAVESLAVG